MHTYGVSGNRSYRSAPAPTRDSQCSQADWTQDEGQAGHRRAGKKGCASHNTSYSWRTGGTDSEEPTLTSRQYCVRNG